MSDKTGIINLMKPPGISSFQAVATVKRMLSASKAGHTGTLDPAAVGVLPICLERATRVIPYIHEEEKGYVGELKLGTVTDTLDGEGTILEKNDKWKALTEEDIEAAFEDFLGEQNQLPPMYSAVHHQGKRLYELAREGKKIKRDPRKIKISYLEITGINLPLVRFKVTCSRGTYIRTLAADIGEKLGPGAHLSFLIRTRSGPFKLDESITFEELDKNKEKVILPIDYPLDYPRVKLNESAKKIAANGAYLNKIHLCSWEKKIKKDDLVLVYNKRGDFIAIYKVICNQKEEIKLKAERVFNNNI